MEKTKNQRSFRSNLGWWAKRYAEELGRHHGGSGDGTQDPVDADFIKRKELAIFWETPKGH